MRHTTLLALASAFAATGCLSDDAVLDDDQTSETTQDIFADTVVAGGTTDKNTVLTAVGATHTCYLRGITGSLAGYDGYNPRKTASVEVEIDPATDHWVVRTRVGKGPGVWAHVSCTMHRVNRVFLSRTHQGAGNEAEIKIRRRCYLTGIRAHGTAMMYRQNNGDLPGARVWTYGGSWRVDTSFIDNADFSIDGGASAVCFDVPAAVDSGEHYAENGDGKILDNPPPDDWACGAIGLWGVFTGSSATGAYSYKSNNTWRGKGTANIGVLSKCIH